MATWPVPNRAFLSKPHTSGTANRNCLAQAIFYEKLESRGLSTRRTRCPEINSRAEPESKGLSFVPCSPAGFSVHFVSARDSGMRFEFIFAGGYRSLPFKNVA